MPNNSAFALFSAASQQAGLHLVDGADFYALLKILFGVQQGLTAHAGGGQAAGTQLVYGYNQVATVASGADSVLLPPGITGLYVTVENAGANSLQVFGQASTGDTIAPNNSAAQAATGTGVAQAAGKIAEYICTSVSSAGLATWKQLLSA